MKLVLVVASLVSLVLAAAAAGAAAPPVRERSETSHLRDWTVTFTYGLERSGGGLGFSKLESLRVRAVVRGVTRLDRTVPLPQECGDFGCQVFGSNSSLLELADLGGGAPTAVLWLWTGGAHCCSIAETVSFATGARTVHDFGNHGASIVRVGSARLFASMDDRFSYLYTSYAASLNPLQLWRLRNGTFVDVTASYPGRIAADERGLWGYVHSLARRKAEVRGAFAAWAADACRLSGRARVEAASRSLVAAGAFSPPRTDPFGPTGRRFPVVLVRDLTRFGYCRSR